MAGATIPQIAPYRLPEQEWYTLEEVADRWSEKTGTKVSPEVILHYGAKNLIALGFVSNGIEVVFSGIFHEEVGGVSVASSPPPNLFGVRKDSTLIDDSGDAVYYSLHQGYSELLPEFCEDIRDKGYGVVTIFRAGSRTLCNFIAVVANYPGNLNESNERYPLKTEVSRECILLSVDFLDGDYRNERGVVVKKDDIVIYTPELHLFEQARDIGRPVPSHAPSETFTLTGALTKELWNSFNPEQRGEQAVRRYKELESNYEAVGREVGVTGACIKQHVKKHNKRTPSEKPNPPSVPSGWNTTRSK